MLLSVNIVSYRSCKAVRLSGLGSVVVFIGKNGAGKTNVLKAIAWAASVAGSQTSSSDVTAGVLSDGEPHVELTCRVDDWEFSYSAQVQFDKTRAPGKEIRLRESLTAISPLGEFISLIDRDGHDLQFSFRSVRAHIALSARATTSVLALFAEHPNAVPVRKFAEYMDKVRYYPLDEVDSEPPTSRAPPNLFVYSEFSAWKSGAREARDANELVLYKILSLSIDAPDDYLALTSLLGSSGLGIVDQIIVGKFDASTPHQETYYFLQFSPSGYHEPKAFPFESLSFGTRRLVRLLTNLFFDGSNVSLFEQPEDGIHAGLLGRLLPLIRSHSDPAQFLISSHSSEVLNRAEPGEVRIVELKDGITNVVALTEDQAAIATRYMHSDGPLAEFLQILTD